MATPSVAAAGLAFAITLLDGGKSVPIDRFTLKVPGAKGALVLSLEGVVAAVGSFEVEGAKRLYVATAGEEGRSGSVRIFRPF